MIKPEYEVVVKENPYFGTEYASDYLRTETTTSTNHLDTGFYYYKHSMLLPAKNGGRYWRVQSHKKTVHMKCGPRVSVERSRVGRNYHTARDVIRNKEYMEKFSFPIIKYMDFDMWEVKYWHVLKAEMSTNPKTIATNVFEAPTPKVKVRDIDYLSYLNLLALGQGIYNPDKIQGFLKTYEDRTLFTANPVFNTNLKLIRRANYVLKKFNISWDQFIKGLDDGNYLVMDTLFQFPRQVDFRRVPDVKIRTIRELHDFLSAWSNNQRLSSMRSHIYEPMSPIKQDGYTLIFPANAMEMYNWGQQQGHCIGTYYETHQTGYNLFFEVQHNGQRIGHAHSHGKLIIQFYGKFNQTVEHEHYKNLREIIMSNGKIFKGIAYDDYFVPEQN